MVASKASQKIILLLFWPDKIIMKYKYNGCEQSKSKIYINTFWPNKIIMKYNGCKQKI